MDEAFQPNTPEECIIANNALLQTVLHNQSIMIAYLEQIAISANMIVPMDLSDSIKQAARQEKQRSVSERLHSKKSSIMAQMKYLELKFKNLMP